MVVGGLRAARIIIFAMPLNQKPLDILIKIGYSELGNHLYIYGRLTMNWLLENFAMFMLILAQLPIVGIPFVLPAALLMALLGVA